MFIFQKCWNRKDTEARLNVTESVAITLALRSAHVQIKIIFKQVEDAGASRQLRLHFLLVRHLKVTTSANSRCTKLAMPQSRLGFDHNFSTVKTPSSHAFI